MATRASSTEAATLVMILSVAARETSLLTISVRSPVPVARLCPLMLLLLISLLLLLLLLLMRVIYTDAVVVIAATVVVGGGDGVTVFKTPAPHFLHLLLLSLLMLMLMLLLFLLVLPMLLFQKQVLLK